MIPTNARVRMIAPGNMIQLHRSQSKNDSQCGKLTQKKKVVRIE